MKNWTDKQIKEKASDKRYNAKVAGFTLNYNGSGRTLALNIGLKQEEGEEIYNQYFESFSGLKKEFERRKQFCQSKGYIITNNVTKRRIYFDLEEIQNKLRHVNWDEYKLGKAGYKEYEAYYDSILNALLKKASIDNQAVNFPSQSSGADITKVSTIKILDYILSNNLQNIVLLPLIQHDEIVCDCPRELKDTIAKVVEDSMVDTGKMFCKIVPLGATVQVGEAWDH